MTTIDFYTKVALSLQLVDEYWQTKNVELIAKHKAILNELRTELKRIEAAKHGNVPWLKNESKTD